MRLLLLLAVILLSTATAIPTLPATEPESDRVRLERPLGLADLGGCAFFRGALRLPRNYGPGEDGRIVIEAEDATTNNIAAEGAIGPFSATDQNLIGTDRRASLDRYVTFARGAQWERAQWKIDVGKPVKLTAWYRIFAVEPGDYSHTESLNGKGTGQRIVTFKSSDPNDKRFQRWQWAKGPDYEFVAGPNVYSLDWHNGARLDQVAFLPPSVQPQGNEMLPPTYTKIQPSATATTRPIQLGPDEQAERLLAEADLAGGQVVWEMSCDGGKTWSPVPEDGVLPREAVRGAATLVFRSKLAESPTHASPVLQGVRLAISKPRPITRLMALPSAFQYREKSVPLIPATWEGIRWLCPERSAAGGASNGRSGTWTLAEPIQPDAQGVLWMDAAKADFIDLLPEVRSWIAATPGAAGQAIRQGLWNRNVISFDLNVPKKDQYRPWFRVQLAREVIDPGYHPQVMYQVDREPFHQVEVKAQGKDYPVEAFRKREWVWLPGKELDVDAGVHTFRLRGGLDYTWLDRVCLAPAGTPTPQGNGGPSTRAAASSGTIAFQPLSQAMARSWQQIQAASQTTDATTTFSWSKDGGKTWIDLKGNSLEEATDGPESAAPPLLLRCTLRLGAQGKSPQVTGWAAVAKEPADPLIQLANADQRILFDPASGDLLGWWSARAGWVIPPGRSQPLFEIGAPMRVLKPDARQLQERETAVKEGTQTLSLQYLMEGGSIVARVRIELPPHGLARWKLTVENHSQLQLYGLNFPVIGGVRIGNEAEGNRAPLIDALTGEGPGALFHPVYKCNPTSGIYPGWTSMGWYTLYGGKTEGAFTLQTRNQDAYHIWMTHNPDPGAVALEYKFSRMLVVDPEAKGEAEYAIGWHEGDWHRSADAYREWARGWMKPIEQPKWVRHLDGWMDGGAMIASRYITHAWPRMEWFGANFSQNFARAMDGTISCTPFPFVNPRLGSAAEFRQAHTEARKRGWYNTYYLNQAWSDDFADAPFIGPTPRRLLPPEIRLRPRGFVEQWGYREGNGEFSRYGFLPWGDAVRICNDTAAWTDTLADAIAWNYAKVLGADGVYLDQSMLGANFCFNAQHDHGSQRAVYGVGFLKNLAKVFADGRRIHPEFAMAGEGNNDQYMQFIGIGLWLMTPFWDGNVYQYTFPEFKLTKGHHNGGGAGVTFGEFARYLSLFLVHDVLGGQHELKELYAHRRRIGDWMHEGQFQDNVGLTISKPGIEAKWFRREDREHLGALINLHNEDRVTGAEARLRCPNLKGVRQALVYLWGGEVQILPVQWDGDTAVVAIPDAPFATAILIAKAPKHEAIRGHCYWPLRAGPEKVVLVLANTGNKARNLKLTYTAPPGITLKEAPSKCKLAAGQVARLEIPMEGVARLPQRGRVEIQAREWFSNVLAASCVIAPPIVNGGFETDTMGNGTPDMWGGVSTPILTQILQLKELPPGIGNDQEVIHHADGLIDTQAVAEGKNALLLPGRLMLPYTWCRDPETKGPIPNQPYYFQSGQPLILKPGTKYRLSLKHKQEADDGLLEVTAEVCEWPCKERPAFALQTIPAVKGERAWQAFAHEFETPVDLAGPPEFQITNKGTGKAWLDDVRIEELGTGR